MFAYYLQLGLRSMRRNFALTALMIMAVSFGVASSTVSYAVFRATASNPIPQKSSRLYVPQIDNFGPDANENGEPPSALSYIDAMALMRAHKAQRETALYPVSLSVTPGDLGQLPVPISAYAVYGSAFQMFDIPFLYGGGWTGGKDDSREAVVVISRELNDALFGGGNSVGRSINLSGHDYRINGVMDNWNPQPLFFDPVNTSGFTKPVQVFVPFSRAIDLQLDTAGSTHCSKKRGDNGRDAFLHSECTWIEYWAELPDKAQADTYREFLYNYAAEQEHAGRFHWAPNVRLRNVTEWLDYQKVVPPEAKLSLLVSLGFFLICLVNTVGLLLAKFMLRAPEVGIRRALGASRGEIYAQFLVEAGTIGLTGGVLGLLFTGAGVMGIRLVFDPQIARLATLDFSLLLMTLLVAILATVIAAFYPTWRAAQVQPAWQLKIN